jgi:uncharacterized protein
MTTYRIPGIYTEEISTVPPMIEEVETAIPAFVGYTARAVRRDTNDLIMVPTKIGSMREFEMYFGYPFENELVLKISAEDANRFRVTGYEESELKYLLYYSIRIYFQNGGGPCYILSVDTYSSQQQVVLKGKYGSGHFGLLDGLNKLSEVEDTTLITIPEAVKLSAEDYSVLVKSVLLHCNSMRNRFAIFDLYDGDKCGTDINKNRSLFGNNYLKYGSAYYPYIRTKMTHYISPDLHNVIVEYEGEKIPLGFLRSKNFMLYKFVRRELNYRYVILPPSGAVTGVYVATDKNRGVWKSPANVKLNGVIQPVATTDNQLYDMFNEGPETRKSINNIKSVAGKGPMVLGSRTLATSENDGKYIPVNRFATMVLESLRQSTSWVVFENNDAATWNKICQIIENYLTQKWQEGALAGLYPQVSFYVKCGLGETMTGQDILEGKTSIEIGLAMIRPFEFTVLFFTHQSKILMGSLQIA